jgi:flagellar biosynthesis protein FlhF
MDLSTLLRRSGLSELALGRLKGSQIWPSIERAPLHRALVDIGNYIRETASAKWSGAPLRRAAFLGTAGSGRTTALCKWLGLEVFRRARAGHVVTVEFDRPNPPGALPVYCEALGVPLARFPASTEPAVSNGFVYLDLPGLSLTDPRANQPLADFLDRENITERVLVLNAAYDHACLRAAYTAARGLGATHVVFTHLDEVTQWGRLWDYLLDGVLEPLFLGTGPTLTGDCEDDVFGALVRRTLAPVSNEIPFEAPPRRRAAVSHRV